MSFPNFHTNSYISSTVHHTNPYITLGWPVKIRTDFGSAQNAQLLDGFFARTELLALAGVDSLVLVSQKKDQGKSRSFSAVVGDFCSLPVRAHRCRTASSSVHWKLVSYLFLWALKSRQCYPFSSEVFCKCSNSLFEPVKAGSELTENGLLSDSERRKWSMAALRWISLMNFCKLTLSHLSSSQTCKKLFGKTSTSSFDISSTGFETLVPPGLGSHPVTLR